MKRSILLKSVVVALAMILGTSTVSAQKFLNKVKKAAEVVTGTDQSSSKDLSDEEKKELEELKKKAITPLEFTVVKLNIMDENGNQMKNEDGTDKYRFLLRGSDGKYYTQDVAKKYVADSWKAGGIILAKVGGGAALGAATGALGAALSGGNVAKSAAIGAGGGAAVGIAAVIAGGDIKKIKANRKSLKNVKAALAEYEQSFTDEGLPRDASVDLTPWEGCEEVAMVDSELMAKLEETAKNAPEMEDEDVDDILDGIKG